jgi:hypothetical protein
MDFPLTRERLQKIHQQIMDDAIEKLILAFVDDIKNRIINKAYQDSKLGEVTVSGRNIQLVNGSGPRNMLKVDIPPFIQNRQPCTNNPYLAQYLSNDIHNKVNIKQKLPVILEKLQELFPDVSFQVDPLQTYILIDWS